MLLKNLNKTLEPVKVISFNSCLYESIFSKYSRGCVIIDSCIRLCPVITGKEVSHVNHMETLKKDVLEVMHNSVTIYKH